VQDHAHEFSNRLIDRRDYPLLLRLNVRDNMGPDDLTQEIAPFGADPCGPGSDGMVSISSPALSRTLSVVLRRAFFNRSAHIRPGSGFTGVLEFLYK